MAQYFKNIYNALATIAIGMKITLKHFFLPNVTIQYPEVKPKLPERERNRLYVNIDDCIGCDQCSRACPVACISIETVKGIPTDDLGKTSAGKKKALWVTKFDIDFAKCCYCQLCVFPCPSECIYMTDVYEYSEYNRADLLYHFSNMTPEEIETKKLNFEKAEAEKAALKAAALQQEAAAKAAGGDGTKPSVKTDSASDKKDNNGEVK
jgi:NADH-quinone oxidoreductase subunit I